MDIYIYIYIFLLRFRVLLELDVVAAGLWVLFDFEIVQRKANLPQYEVSQVFEFSQHFLFFSLEKLLRFPLYSLQLMAVLNPAPADEVNPKKNHVLDIQG